MRYGRRGPVTKIRELRDASPESRMIPWLLWFPIQPTQISFAAVMRAESPSSKVDVKPLELQPTGMSSPWGGETRVPEDLRLVGFDDVRFANLLTIPLTTMQQPCRDIALTAFNCIRERIASPSIPARSYHARPRK
jgi:hypothetical protein